MTERVHLRVESDGTYHGTRVTIDGEELLRVRALRLDIEPNALARVALEVVCPEVVIDGEFKREIHTFESDEPAS